MKEEELSKLIEKYYDGVSTEAEELLLKEYFKKENIPDGFKTEKAIFGYYEMPLVVPEPSPDFESRIVAGIDLYEDHNNRHKFVRPLLSYLTIAASLLILVASYFFIVNKRTSVDTFSDPAIAYTETMKILMEVSLKLNSGTRTLEPIGKISEMTSLSFESINKSAELVGKKLRSLDYLQQAAGIGKMVDVESN